MCLGAYKVNKERTAGFPAWKRGLLAGVIGLAAVGAAAGIRDRQNEGGRAMRRVRLPGMWPGRIRIQRQKRLR